METEILHLVWIADCPVFNVVTRVVPLPDIAVAFFFLAVGFRVSEFDVATRAAGRAAVETSNLRAVTKKDDDERVRKR